MTPTAWSWPTSWSNCASWASLRVLVEGGGRVLDSFVRERLFDEMAIFFSNKIVGGRNSVQIFASGSTVSTDALELVDCRWSEFAGGAILRGYRKCSPD